MSVPARKETRYSEAVEKVLKPGTPMFVINIRKIIKNMGGDINDCKRAIRTLARFYKRVGSAKGVTKIICIPQDKMCVKCKYEPRCKDAIKLEIRRYGKEEA